jgi:hypothetical protein
VIVCPRKDLDNEKKKGVTAIVKTHIRFQLRTKGKTNLKIISHFFVNLFLRNLCYEHCQESTSVLQNVTSVYPPHYITKVEKKGRTIEENQVITYNLAMMKRR